MTPMEKKALQHAILYRFQDNTARIAMLANRWEKARRKTKLQRVARRNNRS